MNACATAAILLVTVLAGYPAAEAQTTSRPRAQKRQPQTTPQPPTTPRTAPQPPTTPEPRTAPAPLSEPREPAQPAVPAEERPLAPSGTDVLSPPRTDFLSRLRAGVGPGEELRGWYVIPSLSLSEIYDSNIFGRSSDGRGSGDASSRDRGSGEAGDFITQVSPGLVAGYESSRFRLLGGYRFDSQWYADHSELNSALETQVGQLQFGYVPTPSLRLNANASYQKSKNTDLVTQETGASAVNVGRRGGGVSVATVSASAAYDLMPLTVVGASYGFTYSDLGSTAGVSGSTTTQNNSVNLTVSRELSPLDRATLSYGFSFFETDETTGHTPSTFHTILVGYARDFSQDTGFLLALGPQFSDSGDVRAAANAQLRWAFRYATVFLAYSRGQGVVVGLTGPQASDTLAATITFDPIGPWTLNLASSVSRSSDTEGRGGDRDGRGLRDDRLWRERDDTLPAR